MADKTLKSITFPGLPDRYVVPDYSADIEQVKEDLKRLNDLHDILDASSLNYSVDILSDIGNTYESVLSDYVYYPKGTRFHVDSGYKFSLGLYLKNDGQYTYRGRIINRTNENDFINYFDGIWARLALNHDSYNTIEPSDLYDMYNHITITIPQIDAKKEKQSCVALVDGNVYILSNYGKNTDEYNPNNNETHRRTPGFIALNNVSYLHFDALNSDDVSGKEFRVIAYDNNYSYIKNELLTKNDFYFPTDDVKYIKVVYYNTNHIYEEDGSLEIWYCGDNITAEKCPYNSGDAEYGNIRYYVSTKDSYYTSMIMKLPPNYTKDGAPTPLIIFFQAASDYNSVDSTTMSTAYEPYLTYLKDNGFCVFSFHGSGNELGNHPNMLPLPRTLRCMKICLNKLFSEYNIDRNRIVVSCKSMGGYMATLIQYEKFINVKAIGMHAPAMNFTQHAHYYQQYGRIRVAEQLGFDYDVEWFTSSNFDRNSERCKTFLEKNGKYWSGYEPYWKGLIGNSLLEKCDDSYNRIFNSSLHRVITCPIKIWISADDANVPYAACDAYIKQAQNAGYNAQLRTLPNNTGKHWATDTDPNALKTLDVTTRLGKHYDSIPTAYYELCQFFIKELGMGA